MTHWFPMKTYSSESVIAVLFFFLWQGLGDHTDVLQGLVFYIVLTGCLWVFSWLGNDLTTEVSENIHLNYSSSLNYFLFAIKERLDLVSLSTPQCLLHKKMYTIFLSGVLRTYLLSQIKHSNANYETEMSSALNSPTHPCHCLEYCPSGGHATAYFK